MTQINWLEWLGYGASGLVVLSLMMKSIVRLRWLNLAGAAAMSVYGVLIHAAPVAVLNGFIVLIDVYYLRQMYFQKDYFTILQPRRESRYLARFLSFYETEIRRHIPGFDGTVPEGAVVFFVLRNMVPAGLFIGVPTEPGTLRIVLDFVIPSYRDFKIGRFLFEEKQSFFPSCGFTRLIAEAGTDSHAAYLKRMGFQPVSPENRANPLYERILPVRSEQDCPLAESCACRSTESIDLSPR